MAQNKEPKKDGEPPKAQEPQKSLLRDYTETILVCVMFVIFSRAFVFQQSKIPSGSMEDTLLVGDYIMVNRFVYSPTATAFEDWILPTREIRRGDVVVFKHPDEPEIDYIKRVIGLPGDLVEQRGRYVYVNGERMDETYVSDAYRYHPANTSFSAQRVPDGHYWVMGDHRNSSSDSRRWGFVPRHLVKGRALLIWWSYEEESQNSRQPRSVGETASSIFEKVTHLPFRSRWSRCFTLIR